MSDEKKFGLWLNRPAAKAPASSGAAGPKNVKQRWLIVGAAVAGFAVVASSVIGGSDKSAPPAKKETSQMVDLTPKAAAEKSWQAQSQQQIQQLGAAVQDLKTQNQRLLTELETVKKGTEVSKGASTGGQVPPPTPPGVNGLPTQTALPPVVPPPPMIPTGTKGGGLPPIEGAGPSSSAEPQAFKPEKTASNSPAGGTMSQLGDAAGRALDSVKASVRYKKNPNSGLLPAGAFAPVALLNGLDAGTSVANQSNPQPVLLNIQDNAVLPGAANYKLKSCFALASAYGDLSAERVYLRLARLSCVDKASRLVLTTAVQGYVVDSDGKLGLRGKVVDRQGARLGKALLAGFAQGLSSALGSAQGTTTTSALGAATSLSGTAALQASGLTGASSAANQLAQFYLKEAQAIFPVITVDTGRTATLVFSDSVALKWGEGDPAFTKEVTPQ